MAKSNSPIRLQQDLVHNATLAAVIEHRSLAQQIEYWADLGRRMSKLLSHSNLMDIQSGALVVELKVAQPQLVGFDDVITEVEGSYDTDNILPPLKPGELRYQPCSNKSGYIEQISANGRVTGKFENGQFVAQSPDHSIKNSDLA